MQTEQLIEEAVERLHKTRGKYDTHSYFGTNIDYNKLEVFLRQELSTITSKSAEVELPHGLKITSYGFDDYNHPTIDRVAEDKYSIRFMRMRFTKRGDWIHEPQPSSRTPSFFKRTQMTLQEAFEKYPKSIEALSQKEQS